MTPDEQRARAQQVAAVALTLSMMGESEATARDQFGSLALQLELLTPAGLRAVAGAIRAFPPPPTETPEATARQANIRKVLGLADPHEQLEQQLRACEWVERLADDLERLGT